MPCTRLDHIKKKGTFMPNLWKIPKCTVLCTIRIVGVPVVLSHVVFESHCQPSQLSNPRNWSMKTFSALPRPTTAMGTSLPSTVSNKG